MPTGPMDTNLDDTTKKRSQETDGRKGVKKAKKDEVNEGGASDSLKISVPSSTGELRLPPKKRHRDPLPESSKKRKEESVSHVTVFKSGEGLVVSFSGPNYLSVFGSDFWEFFAANPVEEDASIEDLMINRDLMIQRKPKAREGVSRKFTLSRKTEDLNKAEKLLNICFKEGAKKTFYFHHDKKQEMHLVFTGFSFDSKDAWLNRMSKNLLRDFEQYSSPELYSDGAVIDDLPLTVIDKHIAPSNGAKAVSQNVRTLLARDPNFFNRVFQTISKKLESADIDILEIIEKLLGSKLKEDQDLWLKFHFVLKGREIISLEFLNKKKISFKDFFNSKSDQPSLQVMGLLGDKASKLLIDIAGYVLAEHVKALKNISFDEKKTFLCRLNSFYNYIFCYGFFTEAALGKMKGSLHQLVQLTPNEMMHELKDHQDQLEKISRLIDENAKDVMNHWCLLLENVRKLVGNRVFSNYQPPKESASGLSRAMMVQVAPLIGKEKNCKQYLSAVEKLLEIPCDLLSVFGFILSRSNLAKPNLAFIRSRKAEIPKDLLEKFTVNFREFFKEPVKAGFKEGFLVTLELEGLVQDKRKINRCASKAYYFLVLLVNTLLKGYIEGLNKMIADEDFSPLDRLKDVLSNVFSHGIDDQEEKKSWQEKVNDLSADDIEDSCAEKKLMEIKENFGEISQAIADGEKQLEQGVTRGVKSGLESWTKFVENAQNWLKSMSEASAESPQSSVSDSSLAANSTLFSKSSEEDKVAVTATSAAGEPTESQNGPPL